MPRKTKDVEKEKLNQTKVVSKVKKTNSNSSNKDLATSKNNVSKKESKKSIPKKASTRKRTPSSMAKPKNSASKKSSLQIIDEESNISLPKKRTRSKINKKEFLEYYDLPYRYNETIVKILAQTPKKLFVYWDISDDDRKNYIDKFGTDFFNNTVPVLIVHNDSMNYTFEVEINDFANCWYIDINDSKCKYTIEFGRRSKSQNYYIPNNYIYIASSNSIETPNDHILFESQNRIVNFKNIKNNITYSKDITTLSYIRNMKKIYNINEAYIKMYNEIYNNIDVLDKFDINNPTSGNPSSNFK